MAAMMSETVVVPPPTVPKKSRANARRSRSMTGNLNAATQPWRIYWRRRALRREDRWVLKLVEDYIPALVTDKGGDSQATAAEQRLIELAAAARVCWLLALAHARDADCSRFMAVERGCLRDLGLERRAKPIPSLREIMAGRSKGVPG